MGVPLYTSVHSVSHHSSLWGETEKRNEDLLMVKKTPPDSGSGFIIGSPDAVARVAHLEHSVRFLQEQHRLMLSGLHAEIEALRERNRDLQFQLIFNKESSPKITSSANDETATNDNNEANLKREVNRLEKEAAAARSEARAAEAKALQLQRLLDTQTEKVRELELKPKCACTEARPEASDGCEETRGELRARLAEAERLVRRLRGDADRQRRELQCMKNSLHASLRASGLDGGYGYQNNYHFPPVHTPDFWREPLREDYNLMGSRGRSTRRPLTLPELTGQPLHRSSVYANNHARGRANGYEQKNKKTLPTNGENVAPKSPEEPATGKHFNSSLTAVFNNLSKITDRSLSPTISNSPELKVVVTKMIHHGHVSNGQQVEAARPRARRHHHRKHAPEHT
ncbi:hypothetical protein K1T71_008050 [Dendrolimus kikuchii]|uniref:Uncharacterized protein n=1 Tax=Dendrolimus kikuchii TaxID=765133 RepID=A0ACC1CZ67_9NEOP|nr:hypothetical protein K1T71_008050 [Dendrolimus kikuchii]